MEIYTDRKNELAYVGDGRGPFTIIGRDGVQGESYIPRGAVPILSEQDMASELEEAANIGYDEGQAAGYAKGVADGRQEGREETFGELAYLRARLAKRYHPLRLKATRGRP